ncbi:MAG: DUF255 domain-containing protein [Bacteroidales bacterium]|nr:DUF255 domain-containing protein [Bacteroidales bacterium]
MKSKTLILLILAFMTLVPHTEAQTKWHSIDSAATANLGEKMVFIDFYTSWCGWCKRMDRDTFTDPTVAKIMEKYYYPVKFDAEGNATFNWNGQQYKGNPPMNGRRRPHEFAYAVLGQQMGFPSFAIFNSEKNLIQVLPGYYPAKDFVIILWYFASGDYKKYPFDRYQQIFETDIKPNMEKQLK